MKKTSHPFLTPEAENSIRQEERERLKTTILKMVADKITETHEKYSPKLIIDRIGEVAMKELYNNILKLK